VIEFSHRITSTLAGIFLIVLLLWAIRIWRRGRTPTTSRVAAMAAGSFLFVVIEGLLGAGLVLTGNTAENLTPERPFWMAAHLLNTLILLAFLTLTAWFAGGGGSPNLNVKPKYLAAVVAGAAFIFIAGMSGSIAALAHMIFPSTTLAEGIAKDFSAASNALLRLRLLHPLASIFAAVFLVFMSGWLKAGSGNDRRVARLSNLLTVLVLGQVAFGAATLFMLAPIIMQLGHLLLADAIWINYVLLSAAFLSIEAEEPEPVRLAMAA
jgi:heme A synthase